MKIETTRALAGELPKLLLLISAAAAAFVCISTIHCDSASTDYNIARERAASSDANDARVASPLMQIYAQRRYARAASPQLRKGSSRVQLAQRPKTTTTTTTTSSTTTTAGTTTSSDSSASASDESDDSASYDYVDTGSEGARKSSSNKSNQEEPRRAQTGKSSRELRPKATKQPQIEDNEDAGSDDYVEVKSNHKEAAKAKAPSGKGSSRYKADKQKQPKQDANDEEQDSEQDQYRAKPSRKTNAAAAAKSRTTASKSSIKHPPGSASKAKIANAVARENEDDDEDGSGADDVAPEIVAGEPNVNSERTAANTSNVSAQSSHQKSHKKALVRLPFIKPKNESVCTPEAYLEFPRDPFGEKWRARGLVLVHVAIVCYMFYALAVVCERYFMPSLEEFALRLNLSEDVAGATLMSAGSSAPELFTAILGVFIAKGDVGTGAIVGSAVFNILFVIGVCSFVSTTCAQLNWWPVLRDSVYYSFSVLVLIVFIYDERITALESFMMIALYGVYIMIMAHNDIIRQHVTQMLLANPLTAKLISSSGVEMSEVEPMKTTSATLDNDDVFGSSSASPSTLRSYQATNQRTGARPARLVEEDSIYLAACLIIIKHKRLFRSTLRFQSAARYVIIKRQHRAKRAQQQQQSRGAATAEEVNYFGPETERKSTRGAPKGTGTQKDRMAAYASNASLSKNKFSIVSKDDYEFWNRPPRDDENYYLWLARIPVNYVLHYTIPDCTLYPDKYALTFFVSIIWTALFSYLMVWMVTLIGYTFGIPDSVMGVTFLAAGTSVPDCYSSIHAARNGMADMAVSNSIGSNVFDILIGLAVPWFIQSAIYPGVVATINSRGVIYSVVLLFVSLIVTIYLMNKYEWTLKPRLGLALLIAYGLFIVLTCMLEFNLFGHVNPPPCPVIGDS